MNNTKPYHRFYRQTRINDHNRGYNSSAYLSDHSYAEYPEMYIRSFNILQKDILELFEYIEPSDANLSTYSLRIYDIYVRICLEVEANFKAILRENIYGKDSSLWNIKDYFKINKTHHLSGYKLTFPVWNGEKNTFTPFEDWSDGEYHPLDWYKIYNNCKHNKYQYMHEATFGNMLKAFTGLLALLSAQFGTNSYSPGNTVIVYSNGNDSYYKGKFGIGGYLQIVFPDDWTDEELYDFQWSELKKEQDRFMKYNFD